MLREKTAPGDMLVQHTAGHVAPLYCVPGLSNGRIQRDPAIPALATPLASDTLYVVASSSSRRSDERLWGLLQPEGWPA